MEEEPSSGNGCCDAAATRSDANSIPVCSKTKEAEEHSCAALRSFQTYGWMPDPRLSNDDNLLDLLLIITRNSTCREGGMGCIITRPNNGHDEDKTSSTIPEQAETNSEIITADNPHALFRSILAVATNRPLYSQNDSDIHAEVCAVGYCARQGSATDGCTAYITMPPCKKCLGALVVAGIGRIVFPRKIPSYLQQVADDTTNNSINLTLVNVNDADEWDRRRKRVEDVIARYHQDHPDPEMIITNVQEEISLRRKQRKEEKQQRKQRRIEKDNSTTGK